MYILGFIKKKVTNVTKFKVSGNSVNGFNIKTVEDCYVDWGDNTEPQIMLGPNDTGNTQRHTYTDGLTEHIISITGNHKGLRLPRTAPIELISLSDTITQLNDTCNDCSNLTIIASTCIIPPNVQDCSSMFENCTKLSEISENFIIPNSVTNCSSMFSGCSSLTSIPKHLSIPNSVTNCSHMFADCSNLIEVEAGFTLGNSLVDCSSMFSYCSNLTTIPPSMKLPNCIQTCQNMFYYDFSQLSSDISYIWPDEFEYTGTIDLSHMFGSIMASHVPVTGTVPADKLWNSGKTFNSSYCFTSCTSLTNYSEIPAGWK